MKDGIALNHPGFPIEGCLMRSIFFYKSLKHE